MKPAKFMPKIRFLKPTVFQGFWHGPPLGPLREACLNSFIQLGHRFELYTYNSINVPKGVKLKQAEDIIRYENIFYYKNPETGREDLGPFSDLFRFKLLSVHGGWWSDVDTICLSSNIPTAKRAWAQELPELNGEKIGTSQIAMQKSDPLVIELYNRCLALSQTDFQPREALGPHLLSATIKEFNLPKNVFGRPDTFYPVRWIETFKLWLPDFRDEVNERANNALFMPIFQSFPHYIGLSLGKMPPRGSYLGEFCESFLPNSKSKDYYTPEQILKGTRAFFLRHSKWAIPEIIAVSDYETMKKIGLFGIVN